jgi:pyridinium-3,5-bisthiocarboxylic acid mononucleotide nickel chelatase
VRRIEPAGNETLVLLETNIDDMSPEIYGYLMEKLFTMQAVDVWFTPIQMKKNRPAVMLSVLAPRHAEFDLTQTIMRETSTLGIRVSPVFRHIAEREID